MLREKGSKKKREEEEGGRKTGEKESGRRVLLPDANMWKVLCLTVISKIGDNMASFVNWNWTDWKSSIKKLLMFERRFFLSSFYVFVYLILGFLKNAKTNCFLFMLFCPLPSLDLRVKRQQINKVKITFQKIILITFIFSNTLFYRLLYCTWLQLLQGLVIQALITSITDWQFQ